MSKSLMFFLAALALAGLGSYFRYQNGVEARRQATAIVQLDQNPATSAQAQTGGTAPMALKTFVAAHTGSSVSYTLKSSFDRAVTSANAAAQAQTATSQVYADAQRACSGKSDSITQARCNQAYINSHLSQAAPPPPVAQPKLSDYIVNLHAPLWTADLAGALFLGAGAALIMAVVNGRRRNY